MSALLKHTTAEWSEREALAVNPAKTCQPVGALYASLGIHGCLPHSHGSQGCCSYHRSVLTRHYKEPVMAATSSFTEGASVFGGQANLIQALGTMFQVYEPEVVAVHTTCLSETIGDDIPQIASKAVEEGKVPKGKYVIHANTPSYVGSHVTGFANMTEAMVKYFAEATGFKREQLNIIPGWVEPSDMREIKRMASQMGIKTVLFPDTSDVLDTPMTGKFHMYPKGGVTVAELKTTGESRATIALGEFGSGPAGKLLDTKCKVPLDLLNLPIGLKATDRLVDALRKRAGVSVPDSMIDERGRLVDLMSDIHQYTHGKTFGIAGDPDQVVSMTEFLMTLDMVPRYIVTGTPGKRFEALINEVLGDKAAGVHIKAPGDLFHLHQWIKQEKVDLLIGGTHLKYIAKDEDIPLLRFGFPILDRVGHSYFPSVGYQGATRLVEKIVGLFLDRQDRDAPNEKFELIL